MQAKIQLGALLCDEDWQGLTDLIQADDAQLIPKLIAAYRGAGAKSFLLESAYIDRDFSAAYSAFYSSLFEPYLKYCRRLHFFGEDVSFLSESGSAERMSRDLEGLAKKKLGYLGFVVVRPVPHAPVQSAVLSADAISQDETILSDVRADHPVHLLGADIKVNGFAVTQQDSRIGACAQAAIWMAGRHFHRDHGGPWFSMVDVNDAALNLTDAVVTRTLPAGSEYLRPDNIVRALRSMDRHPVYHLGPAAEQQPATLDTFLEKLARYLDSGIPVIIGLKKSGAPVGHSVVAIGRVMRERGEHSLPDNPTAAGLISHLIVGDDQHGPACRMPVRTADATADYPWILEEHAVCSITPLPGKVFMTGEAAETLARSNLEDCAARLGEYRDRVREQTGVDLAMDPKTIDPSFYAVSQCQLVARTYLTHGWRYKGRALRNLLPETFKSELLTKQFPRYVWLTEFSLLDDLRGFDQCKRKVRAHVVVDATGYKNGEALVIQIPGLAMFWTFDPFNPLSTRRLTFRATDEAEPFRPKVRGWFDYDQCEIPESKTKET